MLDQLLSVFDVASRLGVSPKTVRRLVNRGQIPSCRVGRLIRVPLSGLEAYLGGSLRSPFPTQWGGGRVYTGTPRADR
jgi:excisionase family DNA binding protein